jgi:hypothetical protein
VLLINVLKSALGGGRAQKANAGDRPRANRPASVRDALVRLANDPLPARHLEVLFDSVAIGNREFLELYIEALGESHTGVPATKWYRRAQRALHLVKYFEYSLGIEGARAECGVYSGFSALLLCKTAAAHHPGYAGEGFHLFDSFEGLSEIGREDRVIKPGGDAGSSPYSKGDMRVPVDFVRGVFRGFPLVSINPGWIPGVFAGIPDRRWSFVHIDVDLYEPTLASLEYFYPRLSKGGVIVNDDYASADFPGSGKAWDDFCADNHVPFLVLDTGQAAIIT